jgi:hypothetical protein
VCPYVEGFCACVAIIGSGAPGPDASTTSSWMCARPDARCSSKRPRLGTPCDEPSLECDYQVCGSYGGDFLCQDGVWAEGNNTNFCSGG